MIHFHKQLNGIIDEPKLYLCDENEIMSERAQIRIAQKAHPWIVLFQWVFELL